jgi:hypothetical protein
MLLHHVPSQKLEKEQDRMMVNHHITFQTGLSQDDEEVTQ